ncbi:MAG: LLM class flavin-dependent oxidoreductase [Actinomycetota bacterium]
MSDQATIGLFLNMGANLGATARDVFDLTLEQATLAEACGFHELWITEHHFIPFGINPSALTAAAFILGRTERIHVGTAVTLSPLHNPIELAEKTALLDQMSGGRFHLGIGRGGYLKDYEVLGVDTDRWADEPLASAERIIEAWTADDLARPEHTTGASPLQPPPLTHPHPPMLLATRSQATIEFAARHGLALQHYFAVPADARMGLEAMYDEAGPTARVEHLHTMVVAVTGDEAGTRAALTERLTESFIGGDWPHVPGAKGSGHRTKDGAKLPRDQMAKSVADGAIVGDLAKVTDEVAAFRERTGATRLTFYVEAIADRRTIHRSIEQLASLAA